MKTSHLFLSLVSLSLTAIGAGAAETPRDSECVQLPVYLVTAPRQTAAEKQIERNLAELRAAAHKAVEVETVTPNFPARDKARAEARDTAVKEPAKPAVTLVVARS